MGGVPIGGTEGPGACCGGYEDGAPIWLQTGFTGWPTLLPGPGGVPVPCEALEGDEVGPFGMGMIF